MAVSPPTFLRYLAENADVIFSIFEDGPVDDADLLVLIERRRSEAQPAADYTRRQLAEYGIIERTAHAEGSFELARPVVELLAWLTRRQMLSSAAVLRGHLDSLRSFDRDLNDAVRKGDAGAAAMALHDADGGVERVRMLSRGNRDSVVTEAQRLRAALSHISAIERFNIVRRLWERHLQPLRDVVSVRGEMELLLDRLHETLHEARRRFAAYDSVAQGFEWTAARLARMRRAAADDHYAAVAEVAPLYEKLRRDSSWLRGASIALGRIRAEGVIVLRLDERLGLVGWRPRLLISDDELRSYLVLLIGYVTKPPAAIGVAFPAPAHPLITQHELRAALTKAAPLNDVLAFILERWPLQSVTEHLRAFGHIVRGTFGPVSVSSDLGPKTYNETNAIIEAWPLALTGVEHE